MYLDVIKSKQNLIIPIIIIMAFIFSIGNSYGDGVVSFTRPAKVVIVSGDLQSGASGATIQEPLVIKLLDKNNVPSAFWEVTFTVISGGGKVSWSYLKPANEIKVATNYQGIASANLTLGNTKTLNRVRATFEDLDPVIFSATVNNTFPVLQPIGDKEINEGSLLKFKVSATDIDSSDTLTLSASPLPTNSSFDPSTGIFSFSPDYTQAGTYNITFKVNDGFAEDSEKITITVKNVNQFPVLNLIGNRSVNENNELAILVSANDPDGDVLTYSALNMPTGATFDPVTRLFKWKPGFNIAPAGGIANFNVIFMVKDPANASDSEEIIITVNDVQPLVPDIRVLPITYDNQPSLDFGVVDLNGTSERIFQIHNDGNNVLSLASIRTTDGQFKFISYLKTSSPPIDAIDPLVLQMLDEATIINYLGIGSNFTPVKTSVQNPLMTVDYPTLNPGQCLLIKAQFKPISAGLKQANFIVDSNDPDEAIVLMKVRGTSTQSPDISITPTSIGFGEVQLGMSLTIPLKIRNDGNGVLQISSITIDDSQFTVSQYSDVNPSSEITVNVRFAPTSIGDKAATLRINNNDPDESVVLVNLTGEVFRVPTPEIGISTTSLSFGDTDVGKSTTKTFQISNTGDAILQIASITSSNSQFTVSNVSNVAIGSQITISVKFTPTSAGTKAGILTINSNDLDESALVVSVQGVGITTPKPNISVSPSVLEFGDVTLGESLTKSFYIYNDGSAVLQISNIASNRTQFTILDRYDVPTGGMTQIRVKFIPDVLGLVEGKITITSNDPDEPSKQIAVRGKGVSPPSSHIRISPTSIDFGDVQVTRSLTKELKIYNDGTTTLTISNITTNNDQFIPIFISTISISPSNYASVSIRFAPGSVGIKSATISIGNNDPDTPLKTLLVQGKGFTVSVPDIDIVPTTLDFDEVEINQSVVSGFYIHNKGNDILQISNIVSNNSQFSIIASSTSIEPDYMAPVAVRFSPTSIGSKTAKITITSNDLDEPTVDVMVYGDGIYPGVTEIGIWRQIKQTSLAYDLNDIFFIDGNRGWIAGYSGTILSSTNAGESWLPQFSGTSRSLGGIFFTDSYNGWSVGQYGTMLRTSNNGTNWSLPGTSISNSLEEVTFSDPNNGWAVGDFGTVMKYNGYSWSRQNSGTNYDLMDIDFVNNYNGWAVGSYGTIIRTTDGGQTWTPQYSGTTNALYGVDFINSFEGWAVGSNGAILLTQNGGQTWTRQTNNASYVTLTDVDFTNSTNGWVVGWGGTILYTADGGTTWIQVDSGVTANLNSVYFIDPDNGWIVGASGTILKYAPGLPTSITSVNVTGSPAHAGGTIKVTAVGQARNEARFSIVGVVSNVAMTENPPGTYIGTYNVPDNTSINVKDASIVVTLTNRYGETATDSSQKVTIDTTSMIESASVSPNMVKLGDTAIINAIGEPGGTARFSIETIITDVLMTETPYNSGKYIGEYRIQQGLNIVNTKVTVKLTDRIGNVAIKDAGLLTIDTVAQIGAIAVTGTPAGFGKTITITMMGEANGTAKLTLKDVANNIPMIESPSGIYTGSYTVAQGIYAKNALVSVSLVDALGNVATKDGNYITIDALCKIEQVAIAGSPGHSGGRITVDISGDPSGSAKFSIAGIIGENTMTELTLGSGKYTGSYTIPSNVNVSDAVVMVTLVDAFGNVAVDTSKKVTIDNVIPVITSVDISGSPGRIGGKIIVNMVGEPKASAKFKIENIADENMQEQPSGSGKYTGSYTISNGINIQDAIVTVTLIDSAGNFATDSSKKVTIDNIAPRINTVNIAGSPGRVGGKIEVSMSAESNGIAKFKIGNMNDNNMTEQPSGSGNYIGSYAIPSNANVKDATVTVTLSDLAGNVSTDISKKVTIDNTAPKFNSVIITGSPARTGEKITITVMSEPNLKAGYKIDKVIDDDLTEQPNGSGKYVASYTVIDGINVNDAIVKITLEDSAGNVATDTSQKITIDSKVPEIESVKVTGSPGRIGGKITVSMVSETGARAKFKIGNFAEENMQEQPSGSGNYTGSYTIIDGVNAKDVVVTVTLIDSVGNVATDISQKVTLDNTAPTIDLVKVTGSPAYTNSRIKIEIQGESGGKAVFSIAGVVSDQAMAEESTGIYTGMYTVLTGVNATNAVVTVTLSDLAGNATTDKTQSVTIDTTTPKITSITIVGSPAKINETITITLVGEKNGTAKFSIANLVQDVAMIESSTTPGTYTGKYKVTKDQLILNAKLALTLKDSTGNISSDTSKTINVVPTWDVNRDGLIDVYDIAVIAKNFGQSVSGKNEADVNGDGVIDILDLAIVCKHFNDSPVAAAPSLISQKLNDDQLKTIKNLYKQINNIPSDEPDVIMAKEIIGNLIAYNTPKIAESQLLQNYPNPFNPETWIPYKLSKPGDVSISIYSMSGQLVRKIDLGHQEIGDYSERDKAVYWDGKNEAGEEVSSGIYFYSIKSGDFSSVKKMIISR